MIFKRRDDATVKKLQDGAVYFLFGRLHDNSDFEAQYQSRACLDSNEPKIRYSRHDSDSSGLKYSLRNEPPSGGAELISYMQSHPAADVDKLLHIRKNPGFVENLIGYISSRSLKNADVYKAAGIDRRLFSKIISDPGYSPARDTAIALALALRLDFAEADNFISCAGYTFSRSNRRDIILEYFFSERFYDIGVINEVLFNLNEKTLGR